MNHHLTADAGPFPASSGFGPLTLSQEALAAFTVFNGRTEVLAGALTAFGGHTQGLQAAFNQFAGTATALSSSLDKFPRSLDVQNQGRVEVLLNGMDLLGKLTEGMQAYVIDQIQQEIRRWQKERLPDA